MPNKIKAKLPVFFIILLILVFSFNLNVLAEDAKPVETVAVKVNGSDIFQKDVDREVRNKKMRYESRGGQLSDTQMAELREMVIEEMITFELLFQESRNKKVAVEDAVITDRMEQLKAQFPDEQTYNQMLTMMGLTEPELKDHIRDQATVSKYIDEYVASKIEVPESELKEFYNSHPDSFEQPEQVRASHILIKTDQNADEKTKAEALAKIKDIQNKLKKGEDFSELAKANSQCPSSSRGGDLDYFGRGQMVKPFEDAAFAMKTGDVSDIVETQFGYHIIKVTDKKEASVVGFEQAKSQITAYLKQQKVRSEVDKLAKELKADASIQVIVN